MFITKFKYINIINLIEIIIIIIKFTIDNKI